MIIYNNYFTNKYYITVIFIFITIPFDKQLYWHPFVNIFFTVLFFLTSEICASLKIASISNVSFDILEGLDLMFKAMILEKVTFEYGMR